jgi:hypothetical protein
MISSRRDKISRPRRKAAPTIIHDILDIPEDPEGSDFPPENEKELLDAINNENFENEDYFITSFGDNDNEEKIINIPRKARDLTHSSASLALRPGGASVDRRETFCVNNIPRKNKQPKKSVVLPLVDARKATRHAAGASLALRPGGATSLTSQKEAPQKHAIISNKATNLRIFKLIEVIPENEISPQIIFDSNIEYADKTPIFAAKKIFEYICNISGVKECIYVFLIKEKTNKLFYYLGKGTKIETLQSKERFPHQDDYGTPKYQDKTQTIKYTIDVHSHKFSKK